MTEPLIAYCRFLDGDASALDELVSLYGGALVRYAFRLLGNEDEAEDAAEDAFVAFALRRRAFKSAEHLRAYLYKTVRNKCMDRFRHIRRHLPLKEDLAGEDPFAALIVREREQALYAALERIHAPYREALHLVFLDGFSAEECARILKKNTKQVYNLLARGKTALREELEKEGIHENEL